MKQHKWQRNPQRKRNRYCVICGLAEVVRPYRYKSPFYGYKTGFEHIWYKRAKIVGEGRKIPIPCETGL